MATIIEKPIIAEDLLEYVKTKPEVEKQVIVHCCFPATPFFGNLIRIWQSTFLIDEVSGHRSHLIHAENISVFPYWTEVQPMKDFWFTLVFSGLPKECKNFDLKEIIPEAGGFFVPGIKRNRTDVYRIKIAYMENKAAETVSVIFGYILIGLSLLMALISIFQLYEFYFHFTDLSAVGTGKIPLAYRSANHYVLYNAIFALIFTGFAVVFLFTIFKKNQALRETVTAAFMIVYILHRIVFNGSLFSS